MATPLIIFISLAGAAALGFLTAWFFQRETLMAQKGICDEIAAGLDKLKVTQNLISTENEALKLSLDSLQKLLMSYESHTLSLEEELLKTRKACEELNEAKNSAVIPEEIIREIEVIREIPILVFREHGRPAMTREEKAAKLIKAFKKGVELEGKKVP